MRWGDTAPQTLSGRLIYLNVKKKPNKLGTVAVNFRLSSFHKISTRLYVSLWDKRVQLVRVPLIEFCETNRSTKHLRVVWLVETKLWRDCIIVQSTAWEIDSFLFQCFIRVCAPLSMTPLIRLGLQVSSGRLIQKQSRDDLFLAMVSAFFFNVQKRGHTVFH